MVVECCSQMEVKENIAIEGCDRKIEKMVTDGFGQGYL